ncbi:MlaA family lipoprotein, partial [Francisella tularensis subsp. holarctica]|uniref:MlaA family lipoprotein n=1 Tax=Francisella tularensis TaxID=263 RepID=UPI002381B446
KTILLLVTYSMVLSSCGNKWETPVNESDPNENSNRKVYYWNNKLYSFLTPAAKAYNFVGPDTVQTGIFNIFQTLFEPSRVANDLFQGEWDY